MKTLEFVVKNFKSQCLDQRDLYRLLNFIPFKMARTMNIEIKDDVTEEQWDKDIQEFTRENILKQLGGDVAFGFEKALDQRGISASLMFNVVKMWNWILEEGLENENSYAMYGLPLFKATAVKYDFDNPIGDDSGSEDKYNN